MSLKERLVRVLSALKRALHLQVVWRLALLLIIRSLRSLKAWRVLQECHSSAHLEPPTPRGLKSFSSNFRTKDETFTYVTFLHFHLTEGTGAVVDVKNSALQSFALEVLPVFPRGNNECGRHRCLFESLRRKMAPEWVPGLPSRVGVCSNSVFFFCFFFHFQTDWQSVMYLCKIFVPAGLNLNSFPQLRGSLWTLWRDKILAVYPSRVADDLVTDSFCKHPYLNSTCLQWRISLCSQAKGILFDK